jgi:hypothetical protein
MLCSRFFAVRASCWRIWSFATEKGDFFRFSEWADLCLSFFQARGNCGLICHFFCVCVLCAFFFVFSIVSLSCLLSLFVVRRQYVDSRLARAFEGLEDARKAGVLGSDNEKRVGFAAVDCEAVISTARFLQVEPPSSFFLSWCLFTLRVLKFTRSKHLSANLKCFSSRKVIFYLICLAKLT